MKLSYISSRGSFSYISRNKTSKNFFVFQDTQLSYIPGNGNPKKFLIFQEVKKLLIFQQVTREAEKSKTSYTFLYKKAEFSK